MIAHLELVNNLSTDCFILDFRQFCAQKNDLYLFCSEKW